MQITNRIDAIEKRAEAINLSLAQICRDAEVHFSTVQRWRSGTDPKLSSSNRILGKLERAVEARERLVLEALGVANAEEQRLAS